MILSVSDQVIVFLWTTVCGMAAAFIYDLFRIFRKAVKTGSLLTFVQDLLYWIIVAVIMSITVFYSNDGEIRGFLFLGAVIGAVLYAMMFSRIIMDSSLFIIRVTVRIIRFISFIVSYPFRLMLKLLAIPARKLADVTAAEIRKARDIRKVNAERARAERAKRAALRKQKAREAVKGKAESKKETGSKKKSSFINRIFSGLKNNRKMSVHKRITAAKKDF
jgi:spore cortex biosynthesis protein YabQ